MKNWEAALTLIVIAAIVETALQKFLISSGLIEKFIMMIWINLKNILH